MKVITKIEEFPPNSGYVAVALGNFDGVHIGHQKLIRKMVEKSQLEKGVSVVFTFNPHPLKILSSDHFPMLLTEIENKKKLMEKLEVDYFLLFPFSVDVAQLSPSDFVNKFLINGLRAKSVFVGYNFTFGQKAKGTADLLKQICKNEGCDTSIVPEVKFDNISVSSTNIRELLGRGNVKLANTLLGYSYNVSGTVVYGDQRGRQMGFPTANMETNPDIMIPENGVYAVRVYSEYGLFDGIANIGYRPTIGNNLPRTIEIHLLEGSFNLYGKQLRIFFVDRIRKEQKFRNLNELTQQIKSDINKAKKILDCTNSS